MKTINWFSVIKWALVCGCLATLYSYWLFFSATGKSLRGDPREMILLTPLMPGVPLAIISGQLGPCAGDYAKHTIVAGNAIFYTALGAFIGYRRGKPIHIPGRCRSCGYDLTGNESGVCSECGRPIK